MSSTTLLRLFTPLFLASTLFACAAETNDGASDTSQSALVLPDPFDAAPPPPPSAGSFACGGIACDAATQYCRHVLGGPRLPMPTTRPLGSYACVPFPAQCATDPSCLCLDPNLTMGVGPRACSDASGGVTVTILAP